MTAEFPHSCLEMYRVGCGRQRPFVVLGYNQAGVCQSRPLTEGSKDKSRKSNKRILLLFCLGLLGFLFKWHTPPSVRRRPSTINRRVLCVELFSTVNTWTWPSSIITIEMVFFNLLTSYLHSSRVYHRFKRVSNGFFFLSFHSRIIFSVKIIFDVNEIINRVNCVSLIESIRLALCGWT